MTTPSAAISVSDADRTALADTVTRFARAEIAPHVDAWDAAGEFPRTLYRRAADLGLLALELAHQCADPAMNKIQRVVLTPAAATGRELILNLQLNVLKLSLPEGRQEVGGLVEGVLTHSALDVRSGEDLQEVSDLVPGHRLANR